MNHDTHLTDEIGTFSAGCPDCRAAHTGAYQDGWDEGWARGRAWFEQYQDAILPLLKALGLAESLLDTGFEMYPQGKPGVWYVEWQRIRRDADGNAIWNGDDPVHETMRSFITIETQPVASP